MVTLNFAFVLAFAAVIGLVLAAQEIRIIYLRRKLGEAVFDTEKRNIQLSYLIKSSQQLSAALSKEKLIRLIIETFGEVTKSDRTPSLCALFLMDYNTNRYVYETGYNMDVTMLSRSIFNLDEIPFKALKKSREIIFFDENDNLKNLFFKENKIHMLQDIDYCVLVPLIVENEPLGVVVSFLAKSSFQFLNKDMRLLESLTGQTSIALGSAVQSELAVLDRLTKIYNHAYFESRLEQEVARSDRYKYPVSLLMIDIDYFKRINDTYGHQYGDMILKELALTIKSNIRVVDLCARYGGEEFAVILPESDLTSASKREDTRNIEEAGGALSKAEHLRKLLEEMFLTTSDGSRIKITVSIGIGIKRFPEGTELTKEDLVKEADRQLYRAKREGRNRVCYPEKIAS